jgi:DNA mismatch endonuclease (patch repair protein)
MQRREQDMNRTLPKAASTPSRPASWATSEAIRKTMLGSRGRDTRPELALRSALHKMGLRFRVAVAPIAGSRRTADIVFPRDRLAVFVDGCFWHGCPEPNAEYWIPKIERNRQRDRETNVTLAKADWQVMRIWQHETIESASMRIAERLGDLRPKKTE